MVFTPKAGTGSMMTNAESVDKARSQCTKGARATQYHAVGAPPRGKVVGGICPQPSKTAGNYPAHDPTLVVSVREGASMTELRRGGRPVVSVREDAFGTVMAALRQEIANHVEIDTARFPFAPLTTNGIRAVTQLDGVWNDAAFAEQAAHLQGVDSPLVADLVLARREWLGQPTVVNTMAMACAVSDLFAAHRRRPVLLEVEGPPLGPIPFQQFAAGEVGSVDLKENPAAAALAPAVEHLAGPRGICGECGRGKFV
ncbi:unnamed protein product, partial [Ixodes pacificus]